MSRSTISTTAETPSRRGRLPADAVDERRIAVLDSALAELLDHGFDRVTMLSVARRAGASKETLYRWYGNRDGLMAALIEHNAAVMLEGVRSGLASDAPLRSVLVDMATSLQVLLFGPTSIALNRMAMGTPELRPLLLEHGRVRSGALVRDFLAARMAAGELRVADPEDAFQVLYGLVIQDRQIRVLLGDEPPTAEAIRERASIAVDRFLSLYAPAGV